MRKAMTMTAGVLATFALAACSSTPGAGSTTDPTTSGEAPGEDKLRVAILLDGETSDRGFNMTGEQAAAMLEEEFGAEATFTESVVPSESADIFRQYARQGYDLVVGWGGQFSDGAMTVGEEFPDTHFLGVSSGISNDANVASYDTAIEQWQFLAGFVLGKTTKSGKVGQISGQCFPSTAANMNGTKAGALYANPDVEWIGTFTGDFEDPTKAQQAAQAMIDQGADVLTTNLNQGVYGVVQAAQSNDGVFVVTEWSDNSDVAPEVIIGATNKTYAPFLANKVQELIDDAWTGQTARFDLPAEWGPGIFKTDLLPDDVFEELLEVQAKIASGEIKVERDETCPGQ